MVDGPAFSKAYKEHREVLQASGVSQQMLKQWDEVASELEKYTRTHGGTGASGANWSTRAQIAMGTSVPLQVAFGALSGHPTAGLASGSFTLASLMLPRALVRIMMEPSGPHMLARALQTGKWSEGLGKIAGVSSKVAVATPDTKKK